MRHIEVNFSSEEEEDEEEDEDEEDLQCKVTKKMHTQCMLVGSAG